MMTNNLNKDRIWVSSNEHNQPRLDYHLEKFEDQIELFIYHLDLIDKNHPNKRIIDNHHVATIVSSVWSRPFLSWYEVEINILFISIPHDNLQIEGFTE